MTESPAAPARVEAAPTLSVVVVGRNEGARLASCLDSITACAGEARILEILYVDSASTDDSPNVAAARGARVIRVQPERPSAALGRNAGWREACGDLILFLDGDTRLQPGFLASALPCFADPGVAIVWGHRREANPRQSIYVEVLDLDWIYPLGDSEFCGGDAVMRRAVLVTVDGYDATLIAGEEPEMCRRIRARGWRINHLDVPMTTHDLAITTFRAYWRRAFRTGYAYSEVAERFRHSADPLWRREVLRNRLHGGGLLFLGALVPVALIAAPAFALTLCGLGTLVILRSALRCGWKSRDWRLRLLYALHSHFQQIPILVGQIAERWDARRGRKRGLIEYKAPQS